MNARPELPLRLDVPGLGPLLCEQALRVLPGQRWTLAGTLADGRAVVAKLFPGGWRARRHFRRERSGLEALHRRGIAAPELLYAGPIDGPNRWLVLTGRIDGVSAERLGSAALAQVLHAVALHHAEGIEQTDAHLGNLLVGAGCTWTLDGAGIRAQRGPLSAWRARRNLALWLAQFPPSALADFSHWRMQYSAARWDGGRLGSSRAVRRALAHARRRREDALMDKALRSCTAFAAERSLRHLRVVDRHFDTPALRALLADPDRAFAAADAAWLKRGNSASVIRVTVDGRALVVKRYNLKTLAHALRRCWRPSRAWHSWRNAQRLSLWGVPTPRPVALLERRIGVLRASACYLSEWLPGEPLADVLAAADVRRRELLLDGLCRLLGELARLRLTHGDLKATNLLVDSDNHLMLLDLDALRRHRRRAAFERAQARDFARLRANWTDNAELLAALDRKLSDAGLLR